MRKKALLLITCAAFICMTGCASGPSTEPTTTTKTSSTTESASDSTEAPAPTETPAPEEPAALSLGKKGTVGDWEITAKKVSAKQKIKNGKYYYFKPGKGNAFVIIDMSVKNKGTKAENFLPRVGVRDKTVIATLYYQDEYEYSATELMGYDKDLTTKSIQPLTKENGILVFEVPKKASKSLKELTLNFKVGDESISYALK